MNNKEIEEFVDVLYPFILKKIKNDSYFKNAVKMKNAIVTSSMGSDSTNIDKQVGVKFPYDSTSFLALNKTGGELKNGDTVCVEYWIDLKNAIVKYKVN